MSVRLYLPFLSCRCVVFLTDFSIHVFETIFASIICQQLGDACFNYILYLKCLNGYHGWQLLEWWVKLHKTLVCGHQLGRVLMASVDFNFGRALCGVLKRYPVVIEGYPGDQLACRCGFIYHSYLAVVLFV